MNKAVIPHSKLKKLKMNKAVIPHSKLKKLKMNKAVGPHGNVLKMTIGSIAPSLTTLFIAVLRSSRYPTILK